MTTPRIAASFANLKVQDMFPYSMQTENILASGASGILFPDADLSNTVDKPFSVFHFIPRVKGLDANSLVVSPQPAWDVLAAIVRLEMVLFTLNQPITKVTSRVDNLVDDDTKVWEMTEPFVLPNSYGVRISATIDTFPAAFAQAGITQLRVTCLLRGFALVVEPGR